MIESKPGYALPVLLISRFSAILGYDWEEIALLVLLISGFSAFQEYDWEEFLPSGMQRMQKRKPSLTYLSAVC